MAFLPASGYFSLDAKYNSSLKTNSMPRWCLLVLILQVWLVYTFAAIAKWYPDWMDTTVASLFMQGKKDYWLIGEFLQLKWVHYAITYVGVLFDFLIVPLLLWKRTRMVAFVISVFFHLFNSVVFQIGIFPYMSIAFALFFFSSEILQKRFLVKKTLYTYGEVILPKHKNIWIGIFSVYFIIQLGLPLRHWFFQDDVLWTEEGHRLSWRMMLRSKQGSGTVWVVNKETEERTRYDVNKILHKKQRSSFKTKPDLIWQLAQRIKMKEKKEGRDVAVYMDLNVSVNGGKYFQYIDPEVDLASEKWQHFKHHNWILPSPQDYHKKVDQK
jgi:hypothetical protein